MLRAYCTILTPHLSSKSLAAFSQDPGGYVLTRHGVLLYNNDTMIELRDRIIDLRRIDSAELQDNDGNWRTHPLAQREALAAVLDEVGIVNALIAYESERQGGLTLIDGHLRANEHAGVWPVLVLDLTDDEADVVLATLDPLAGMARTIPGALASLVDGITDVSPDVQATLDAIARQADGDIAHAMDGDGEVVEEGEARDRLVADWEIERGAVWSISSASVRGGAHRVMCGSSLERRDLDVLFDGRVADMVFTDPPYGIRFEPEDRKLRARGPRHRFAGGIIGDDQEFEQKKWLSAVDSYYAGAIYICAARDSYPELWTWLRIRYGRPPTVIVWVKEMFTMTRRDYHHQHEFLFYGESGDAGQALNDEMMDAGGGMVLYSWNARRRWLAGRGETDLWFIRRVSLREYVHPTQKPVELVERAITNSCQRGGVVADFFGGSGTTMVAAERTGRLSLTMELDPRFVAVTLNRARSLGLRVERL